MHKQIDTTGLDFNIWQIDHDANGNARYMVHYLAIPEHAADNSGDVFGYRAHQLAHIEHAKNMLHGKKYRAKWFGGGIVFQAYAGDPIKHVQAAIRRAETGEDFVTAYNSL